MSNNIVDEIREIFRKLEPLAREHLGCSILDLDQAGRRMLVSRLDGSKVLWMAQLDQAEAFMRDLTRGADHWDDGKGGGSP